MILTSQSSFVVTKLRLCRYFFYREPDTGSLERLADNVSVRDAVHAACMNAVTLAAAGLETLVDQEEAKLKQAV